MKEELTRIYKSDLQGYPTYMAAHIWSEQTLTFYQAFKGELKVDWIALETMNYDWTKGVFYYIR